MNIALHRGEGKRRDTHTQVNVVALQVTVFTAVTALLLLTHMFMFTQGLTLTVINRYDDLIFLYPAERAREPDGE